jgi:hypothetical protein
MTYDIELFKDFNKDSVSNVKIDNGCTNHMTYG